MEESQENHNWIGYTESLDQYFLPNEITDNGRKRAASLSSCGAKTYKLIRNIVTRETDETFAELINIVKNHFNPRPSITVYRFKFHSCFRKQGESIQQYVAKLRCLSEHCDFRDHLEDMIRDRLICGVNDERIHRRLLAESRLDFEKALELATAMETADESTCDIQQGNFTEKPKELPVNCISKEQEKRNVIVVEPRSTKLKSADIKIKSVFAVTEKGTKPANAVRKEKGINKTSRIQDSSHGNRRNRREGHGRIQHVYHDFAGSRAVSS